MKAVPGLNGKKVMKDEPKSHKNRRSTTFQNTRILIWFSIATTVQMK